MNPRYSLFLLGLGLLVTPFTLRAQDKDKVEVLARGPVHEAYAEPTEREPIPSPIINKEPPKPIEELPPDQKPEGENVQWIPGYWSYDEDRKDYLWVSGFWRIAPPGRHWVPGSWRKAGDGWQWTGGIWATAKEQKAQVEYLPKPPAPLDNDGANTPAPSAEHIYVPGSWVWRERYVWRPGFWMEHRPGWVWTSAHYRWTPGGYVYIDGYWDYPLATRGTLFAPVYIPPVVYADPAYVYTPTVYVREECMFGAFFARRGLGCYYFGDYFAPRYAEVGFVSWCGYTSATVRIGGFCDPLFSYYSCGYRSDPFWGGGGCINLFVGRYRGDYARPPQTLVQQTTVINNITNNITNINNSKNNTNVIKNSNLNNVTMLSSIRDGGRDGRRFQTVNDAARADQQVNARNLRDVATRRADAETRLAAGGPKGANNTARTIGLDVPPVRPLRGTGGTGPGTGMNPGMGTVVGNPPKGGPGVGIPPKGGPGTNPGTGTGPGTGVGMGTGPGNPPPPKATPIGKDPKGVVIPPRTDPKLPTIGAPTLPPPKTVTNPPVGGTGMGTGTGMPPIPPKGPVGGTGMGMGNPPVLNPPKNPPTITNPPVRPPVTTPPVTTPPKIINNPPVTNPPPVTTPPVTTPPKSNPPITPPKVTPKVTPKTKSSFEPSPITGSSIGSTPLPATRPAVTPLAQPRPLVASPAPVMAPRITAPAMVNPRPIATPRIAPAPTFTPRFTPVPTPRATVTPRIAPTPTIPSGAAKRPIRR